MSPYSTLDKKALIVKQSKYHILGKLFYNFQKKLLYLRNLSTSFSFRSPYLCRQENLKENLKNNRSYCENHMNHLYSPDRWLADNTSVKCHQNKNLVNSTSKLQQSYLTIFYCTKCIVMEFT